MPDKEDTLIELKTLPRGNSADQKKIGRSLEVVMIKKRNTPSQDSVFQSCPIFHNKSLPSLLSPSSTPLELLAEEAWDYRA